MAKKQRASEGESTYLAPETLPPSVAREPLLLGPTCESCGTTANDFATAAAKAIAEARESFPAVYGHGITQTLTPKGWVAFRVSSWGVVEPLTPKRADGTLEGESKPSAAARMMKAIAEEYR